WLATASVAGMVIAGLMYSPSGAMPEFDPLSDEPITDVRDYSGEQFETPAGENPAEVGVPVRTAAAFIDSGFVASRDHDTSVRTVPFETYDSQPQRVEQVGFDSARVSANRGVWLTGTIEEASDVPRARFTE